MIENMIPFAIGGVWTLSVFIAGMLYRGRVGKSLEKELAEKIDTIQK